MLITFQIILDPKSLRGFILKENSVDIKFKAIRVAGILSGATFVAMERHGAASMQECEVDMKSDA
jgi:hypothetical protein